MRYQPDRRGIRQWLNSAELQQVVVDAAEDIAEKARAVAPRRSGDYAESIRAEADRAGDRVAATVTATAPHAQRVEQRHHVIGRSMDGTIQ